MIRIGIVDYEAKQIDKIPLWYEQQTEILKCFEEDHGMIKKCISIVSYKQNHNNKEDIITDSSHQSHISSTKRIHLTYSEMPSIFHKYEKLLHLKVVNIPQSERIPLLHPWLLIIYNEIILSNIHSIK